MDKQGTINKWSALAKRPIWVLAIVMVATFALAAGATVSAKGGTTPVPLPPKAIETKQTLGGESVSPFEICESGTTGEWHFVITQLSSAAKPPASIQLTFDNGDVVNVPLDVVTGKTAHYRHTAHLEDDLVSATAMINASWSGSFNVSHTPCVKTDTTTATQIHIDGGHGVDVQSTTIALGTSVHDSAVVTAVPGPATGTIKFKFFKNLDCVAPAFSGETVAIGLESSSTGPLAAGSYSFLATYSGDAQYNGSVAACEKVTVGKGDSLTTTEIHLDSAHGVNVDGKSVALGSSIHDKAIVTGSPFAVTGDVNFKFFASIDCTGTAVADGNKAVGTESNSQGPLGAGSYSFLATYLGDGNYNGSVAACEKVTVNQGSSSTVTELHNSDESVMLIDTNGVGQSLTGTAHDKAMVGGVPGIIPTGNVQFTFFSSPNVNTLPNTNNSAALDCTGTGVAAGLVALDGLGVAHPSASFGPLTNGNYAFQATYGGDANYAGSTSACEPFQVTTIKFFKNIDCTAPAFSSETVAEGTASTATGVLPVGSYSFRATYLGDTNYAASAPSACEPFQVTTIKFYKTTYEPEPGEPLAGQFNFQAVGGLWVVDGTVVTPAGDPNNPPASAESASSAHLYIAAGQYSISEINIPAGWILFNAWCGQASADDASLLTFIDGDQNNVIDLTVTGGLDWHCIFINENSYPVEVVTEIHAGADHTTDVQGTTVDVGTIVHDKATVTGTQGVATGTVNFRFYANGTCSGPGTAALTVTLDASGVAHPSGNRTLSVAGAYSFKAFYSGDSTYVSAVGACESLTVEDIV